MPDKVYNIEITINGKDAATAPLGKVNGVLTDMGKIAGGVLLAKGLEKLAGAVIDIGKGAVESAAKMQVFDLSLRTLAAREAVSAGAADNIEQALAGIGPTAEALKDQLMELSLISPFTFDTIANTFRVQMAFGQTSEMSVKLTGAILDTASALGLTGESTDRLAYNFGQINSVGKIMATDLRQLRMVGLDLADVFKDELGMSVEQVNAALEAGKMTMEDVSLAFVKYSQENFGGAAERMSKTFTGLKSSFSDLATFAGAQIMTPGLDSVTGVLGEVYDGLKELLDSGYFEKLGKELGDNLNRILVDLGINASTATGAIKGMGDGLGKISDQLADMADWYAELSPEQKFFINSLIKIGAVSLTAAAGIGLISKGLVALASINPVTAVVPALIAIEQVAEQGVKNHDDLTAAAHKEADANALLSESYYTYVQIMAGALHEKGLLDNADARALVATARQGKSIDDLAVSQRGLTANLGLMTEAQWEAAKASAALGVHAVTATKGINGLREAFNWLRMKEDAAKVSFAGVTGGIVTYEREVWLAEQATTTLDTAIGALGGVTEYTLAANIPLADSMTILQTALTGAGIQGDLYNATMANMQIITGQLDREQYKLQTDMQIVTAAFAAGGITAQQLADYMQQASDGVLALGASERYAMIDFVAGKKATEELALATQGLVDKQLSLASSLKGATDAQIAQAAIQELSAAKEAGKISYEQFATAVSGVQQAFGLATPASQALALGIQGVVLGLEAGKLPAENFDDALKYIITDAHDGAVNIGEVLDKFATTTSVMTPANKSFNDAVLQLADLNLKVMGVNTTISGFDWNALGDSVGAGLAQGMRDSIPDVAAAAAELAAAAESGVADPLGSRSPSKTMFLQGQYAVQGFVMGLMSDAMGGVEQNMSGLFAGFTGGGGSSSNDYRNQSQNYDIEINDSGALEIFLEQQRMARHARAEGLM